MEMIFLLVPAILTITSALQEDSIYRNSIINGKRCHPKPVSELVPLCSKIGYNYTSFPNRRGLNEAATNEELADLKPLIGTNCSNAIVHLLCSIYAPPCMPAYPDWNYPPCKSLCDYVENGCAAVFKQISGYDWPPNPDLNCSQYTTYKKNSLTFCPPDPNKIQMPQPNVAKPVTDPPRNFTAAVISPYTVEFSWTPPDDDEHETYYFTCVPHIVPVRTKLTTIRVLHFQPNTNYSCKVLLAHAKNINKQACSVFFKTSALFPAMTTSAKIISSVEVELSWMHKDREHQKKLEKSSYRISCQNYPDSIVRESTKQNLTLKSLTPGTNYSCNISIPSSLSQFYETSEIAFTTPEILTVKFIENAPVVDGDRVSVKVATNRPVSKIVCQLLNHTPRKRKVDCTNGSATFYGIIPGNYAIRVAAENSRKDRVVIRKKFEVPACSVQLSKISKTGNSVTISFRGTNSNRFKCSLDSQDYFECSSPLFLSNYHKGAHTLVVVPTSARCTTHQKLSTVFTI